MKRNNNNNETADDFGWTKQSKKQAQNQVYRTPKSQAT